MSGPITIPTLDELLKDPATLTAAFQVIEQALAAVPLAELPRLRGDLQYLTAKTDLRLRTDAHLSTPQPVGETGWLKADEVAKRFHVTRKWLYRHKAKMPHSQPSRKRLIFPEQAVTKWFASRRGA